MIFEILNKKELPQKGDPQLDWFYLDNVASCDLTSEEKGRLFLASQDVSTKFTTYEIQIFKRAFGILDRLVKKPPSHWGWQEKQGVSGFLPLFNALSIGAIKSPQDVKSPKSSTTLLHDNKGMGECTSVQSVVCSVFGLAQGFQRIYQDKNCLDRYNSKLSEFERRLQ